MSILLKKLTLVLAITPISPAFANDCSVELQATKTATRLSNLPPEIRSDLLAFTQNDLGDKDSPLQRSDAPSSSEQTYPRARYVSGTLINGKWFIQIEVATYPGVRTIGYVKQANGTYGRSPSTYLGGPACESLKAALSGIYNPGPMGS